VAVVTIHPARCLAEALGLDELGNQPQLVDPERTDLACALAAEPGDLPNAVEWGSVAKRAVPASLVVVADPVWQ
jgi:hypothetical protein